LNKHRKWLIELQQTKDRLEQQYLEEMAVKEARKAEVIRLLLALK
jgi:hypothetical protein